MKLVDLKTAKALQELGYDGEYMWRWIEDAETRTVASVYQGMPIESEGIPAPRLDDAAYFMYHKFKLFASVGFNESGVHGAFVLDSGICPKCFGYFSNYEDALECAVKETIKIIKDRQNK